MKLSLITALCLLEAACGACNSSGPPTPPPAPTYDDASLAPEIVPPVIIFNELVSAGCLAPDDSGDGLVAIVDLEFSDQEPAWLSCMVAGGSVVSCAAPCQ